jgi:hypothetical protein
MRRLVVLGGVALALIAPAAPAMARGRGHIGGGGGFRSGPPAFKGGFVHGGFGLRHGGSSFNFGIGFRNCGPFFKSGFHGYRSPFHCSPYAYGGYGSPYFGGYSYPYFSSFSLGSPYLGYPYLNSPYVGSGYLGTPYISSLYGTPGPTVIQLPPRYVYIKPSEEAGDRRDSLRPQEGDRYYLDQRVREEADRVRATTSIVDLIRRQLRVTYLEPGSYLVRWTGPVDNLTALEFQAVDDKGKTLHSRTVKEAPYQAVLRVPEETAAVHVLIESKGGATAAVKLPVAEFKALQPKESKSY